MADDAAAAAAAPQKPVLYSYWRSTSPWRVRIALALKGIDYEYRAVHLLRDGGEQHKPDYAALNPQQLVPTLLIDGLELTQSIAIIEYLDETRPDVSPLLPKDAASRARVRQIVQIIASDTQPVQNLRVLQKVGDEKKMEWGKYWITMGLDALEQTLGHTAGKYCVGDSVTIADLCLVPQIYNARRFNVDLSRYPITMRVSEALDEIEAFASAAPEKMPDANS